MRYAKHVAVLGAMMAIVGCSHPVPPLGVQPRSAVINRQDIDRVHAASALDAVMRYHPDVLTPRPRNSVYLDTQTHPVVFLDGQLLGQVDELRDISADGINEIRFYSGLDAVRLFGARYGGGVIQIVSRNREQFAG